MIDYIGKLIGTYISTVLGLLLIKLLGWFGAGSLTFGGIFLLGLGPIVLSLLIFLIVLVAGLLTLATAKA
jgi:preprotein translocase subunit SecY